MEQVSYTLNYLKQHEKNLAKDYEDMQEREETAHKAWQSLGNRTVELGNHLRSVRQSIELLEEVL